jgi:hypothetical protein
VDEVDQVMVHMILVVHELEQEQLAMLSKLLVRWEPQRWVQQYEKSSNLSLLLELEKGQDVELASGVRRMQVK